MMNSADFDYMSLLPQKNNEFDFDPDDMNRRSSSPGVLTIRGGGGGSGGPQTPRPRPPIWACLLVFCNRNYRIIILTLTLLILYFTFRYFHDLKFDPVAENLIGMPKEGHGRPSDFIVPKLTPEWYDTNCFPNEDLGQSINGVYEKLQKTKISSDEECRLIWRLFDNMFNFEYIESSIVLPKDFQSEVKGWLGNDPKLYEQVQHQKIYKIVTKGSHEETVFNPLRSKRPTSKSAVNPVDYIANLTASSQPSCDFCKYKDHTAEDTFGRIENKFSASASNTFKLSKFHGLFFVKTHHPVDIAYEAIADLFIRTSQQWFQKAHETDSTQKYPSLLWDALPHAGASQVHPHVHGILNSYHYSGHIEQMHVISQEYYLKYKRSYWTDLIQVHFALGLGLQLGNAVAIVPLFARKDHEYMIISPNVDEDFAKLIFSIIEGYKSKLGVYCFSGGGAYHYMGSPGGETYSQPGLPVMFRFGSRGVCTSVSSDVSSLELYTINNINSDLSATINALESIISR